MVRLEEFSEKHLPKTYQWMLDENLKKNFLFRRTLTPEGHKQWFVNYLDDKSQEIKAIYFNDLYVGNVGLKNIDKINNNAETWIYIGDTSMKGKGIGSLAYKELGADLKPNFKKIYAHIVSFNSSSLKMYEKAGFVKEGDFKDEIYWENTYYNLFRFALYL